MSVEPTDTGQLALARTGDHEALTDLYRRYGQDMLEIAYRVTGSGDDAEDVLQDVFIGLPEALRAYHGTGTLRSWLRRLTARTALMRMRKERRARHLRVRASRGQRRTVDQPAVLDRITLERLLGRMPEPLKLVYLLREAEDCSHAEIAELLGISIAASEVRLHRARKYIRDRVKRKL